MGLGGLGWGRVGWGGVGWGRVGWLCVCFFAASGCRTRKVCWRTRVCPCIFYGAGEENGTSLMVEAVAATFFLRRRFGYSYSLFVFLPPKRAITRVHGEEGRS